MQKNVKLQLQNGHLLCASRLGNYYVRTQTYKVHPLHTRPATMECGISRKMPSMKVHMNRGLVVIDETMNAFIYEQLNIGSSSYRMKKASTMTRHWCPIPIRPTFNFYLVYAWLPVGPRGPRPTVNR